MLALIGFTRFEAAIRDIHGEYETDVERADIAIEPTWYPAVENRGEGVFLQLRSDLVDEWLERDGVRRRIADLQRGHMVWAETRKSTLSFPGGAYILLHTLAHLLIQSLAMRCGYPASSIRERIYTEEGRYGILLYTGTPDAEGTLGGLVQQGRYVEDHLADARAHGRALLERPDLCSTCARRERQERLPARGGLPRLHAYRRDILRDA